MKLLIHDLSGSAAETASACAEEKGWRVIADDGSIRTCTGCFGCWVKTPGICVIRDRYGDMGELLAQSDEMVLVARCCYGSPSPFVKNVMDRSISYVLPDFIIKNKEMHHRRRYDKSLQVSAVFYGEDLTAAEKETAEKWVRAMAVNLYGTVTRVLFQEGSEAAAELEAIL